MENNEEKLGTGITENYGKDPFLTTKFRGNTPFTVATYDGWGYRNDDSYRKDVDLLDDPEKVLLSLGLKSEYKVGDLGAVEDENWQNDSWEYSSKEWKNRAAPNWGSRICLFDDETNQLVIFNGKGSVRVIDRKGVDERLNSRDYSGYDHERDRKVDVSKLQGGYSVRRFGGEQEHPFCSYGATLGDEASHLAIEDKGIKNKVLNEKLNPVAAVVGGIWDAMITVGKVLNGDWRDLDYHTVSDGGTSRMKNDLYYKHLPKLLEQKMSLKEIIESANSLRASNDKKLEEYRTYQRENNAKDVAEPER